MLCHVAFHDVRASLVRAERHGSLKLELCPRTEALPDILRGSRVEFGQHVGTEKRIKNWLLNGTSLHAGEQVAGPCEVVGLASSQEQADRDARRVHHRVYLRAQTAAGAPGRLVPAGAVRCARTFEDHRSRAKADRPGQLAG